ncbi:hypothetical protein [Streptomyces antarcticus]|uniref:hypothetical protein n=1 Tax=Streptomyces antarcticus TaxID=2996458 RepID=UPI00227051C6|nr:MULTISPECIES: hypothetical protein [unclassified Streptomyces]MCY0945813.1 hypothetical protein [Streptomyces sp. H34-AA3]MCZ4084026.1 hypothetical protein [Streptomyces sp. H34-S5]
MTEPPEPPAAAAPAPVRADGPRPRRVVKSVVSAVLITLTCILVPLSLLTVWVHDIVLDTNRYVSTVSPLASDPAIEAAAVHRITEAADVRVDGAQVTSDLAAWLESQGLPARVGTAVKALGPQLDSAADAAVSKVATRFVESDRFEKVWTTANRAAHSAVVHALTGQGRGAVGVEGGTVTLDVGTAVETVKQDLVKAGLAPAEKIPEVNKQMVLFQSDKLAKIRGAVHLLDVVGNWLPVLTVILGAIGVLLARRRRRALVTTMLCAAAACLILAIGLAVARRYYLDHLPEQVQSPAAAAAVFDTLVRFLKVSIRTAMVLGVVVAIGAYLSGAGRLPRGMRAKAERTADSAAGWGASHGVHTGRVGTWVQAHRRWITMGALLFLALVFALWNHPTVLTVLLLVLILLAVLAVLALLAADGRVTTRPERPAGREPDTR